MARSVTIRNVPDSVHRSLAARAAQHGQSLQEYLLSALARFAERASAAEFVDRARARKAVTSPELPAERILAHRDSDRR